MDKKNRDEDWIAATKRLRNAVGMTQEQFAHELKLTVGTVNRWENGACQPSRLARRVLTNYAAKHRIAIDFGLSVGEATQGERAV